MLTRVSPYFRALSLMAFLLVLSTASAHADTVTTVGADPNAPQSNFANPGNTNAVGYSIATKDSNGYLDVTLTSAGPVPGGYTFANLYFETDGSTTTNNGSQLGFEFNTQPNDAFIPGGPGGYSLAGQGVLEMVTLDATGDTIMAISIPNSFFENDPLNMGFAKTPVGGLVALHLSQSFGYSVAGGGNNYPFPSELGSATLNSVSPTPEPSSLVLMATGTLSVLGVARRRFQNR